MAYQTVFRRYETKYMMAKRQKTAILAAMLPYMSPDGYGPATIRNIYFDTDSYRLARRSREKPLYKEKLRIRSYREARAQDEVFVELKKKYDRVVYKRRESLPLGEALEWMATGGPFPKATQIGKEIDYFFQFYQDLKPRVFLSYEREAFYARDGSDLRITFDENILARQEELSLSGGLWGQPLIAGEMALMEIKAVGAMPLWLARLLSREKIYKASFSKYGTAYAKMAAAVQPGRGYCSQPPVAGGTHSFPATRPFRHAFAP